MLTERALATALAALAVASAVTIAGLSVGTTTSIAQPANEISTTRGLYPAHPWGPHCWAPDGSWNADCGHGYPPGPGMGPGHHGPGMGPGHHGPGMGHGHGPDMGARPWGNAGW